MTTLTCEDVEVQVELFAAGECDGPTQTAIADHLAGCPQCAGAAEEARMLLGILTLRHRERNALQRLRQTIQETSAVQTVPMRKPTLLLRVTRRAAAVAALFLCVVGIWTLLDALRPTGPFSSDDQIAQVQPKDFRNGRAHPEKLDQALTKMAVPAPGVETYGYTFLIPEGQAKSPAEFLRSHPCVAGKWQYQGEFGSYWIGTLSDATGNVPPTYPAAGESATVGPIKILKVASPRMKTWQGQVILLQKDPSVRFGTPLSLESAFRLIGYETNQGEAETKLFQKRPELKYVKGKPGKKR